MLSIALSFYMVGCAFNIPSLNVPFGLFVVGVFLGIVKKPYNYLLYFFAVLSELPNIFIGYQRMLSTIDAEILAIISVSMDFFKQKYNDPTFRQTTPIWEFIVIIVCFIILGYLLINPIKSLLKNARFFIIISSYPIFAFVVNFAFLWLYIMLSVGSMINIGSFITQDNAIEIITPFFRNMVVYQRVIMDLVCIIFAPFYAYLVARELKIYKRLGIGN